MTDLPCHNSQTLSQSKITHHTSESPVVAPRTPPDSLPTEGIMNIPQDRLFHAPPRTPSSDTNTPPPVLAIEQQPRDQRLPPDSNGSAELCTFNPIPDKYNIPPHHPAFSSESSDIRPSNPFLTSTPSRTGPPYSAASELDVHSDNDEVRGDLDDASKEDCDPSKLERDAPSSTRLLVFDVRVDSLSGVNDPNCVSVSVNDADGAHLPGCSDHGYPSSSKGAAQSNAPPPSPGPSQMSYIPPHPEHASLVTSAPATEQPAPQLVMEPETYPTNSVQQYFLMSHRSDYALVEVLSRGPNDQEPLLYFGEELTGFIVLSPSGLGGMQRIDLVLQVFDSDPIIPSGETKRVLLPQQVDSSHFSDGQYRWPFSIPSPPVTTSSASSSSAGHPSLGHRSDSSLGHRSPSSLGHRPPSSLGLRAPSSLSHRSYDRNSDPKFQLVVTMHRPGLFTRNIVVRQQICYVTPPDPSIPPHSSPISFDHPPNVLPDPSWSPQNFPSVMVRGVMFPQRNIEVECKLFAPDSYPVSDTIPLRLTITSENREALDLVAVPDVIDVRLFKVIGFGEKGKVIQPFSLKNRSSYHRTDLAAEAIWELDGHPKELPTSEVHPWPRWHIGFNGNFRRKTTVKLVPSFEGENMVIRYVVCLYPFRAPDFRPASDPDKPLFMGNIPLRER